MERTRVYFVFGDHGPMESRKDPRFFSRAVCGVLREEVISRGNRAAIIHESVPVPAYERADEFGRFLRKIFRERECGMGGLREHMKGARRQLEMELACMDRGESIVTGPDGMLGFEPAVVRINRELPGRIKNLAEPWTVRSTLLTLCMEFHDLFHKSPFGEKTTDPIEERLAVTAGSSLERDLLVLRLIGKLAEEEPDRAIIVPRGDHHRLMARYAYRQLDKKTIEARAFYEAGWEIGLHFENMLEVVLSDLYQMKLDRARLGFYSQFALECQMEVDRIQEESGIDINSITEDAMVAIHAEAFLNTYAKAYPEIPF